MVAAGASAGAALSIKQSAADSLGTLLVWLALASIFGLVPRREAIVHLGRCALGAGVVIGAVVLHGALTGWDRWYYAVFGYRLSQRSALQHPNWKKLTTTAADVLPIIWPVVAVAVLAALLMIAWRRQRAVPWRSTHLLLLIWVDFAAVMFLSGGQFFHHYWLTLTYPLAALGGLVIGGLGLRWWRRALITAALVPALVSWMSFAGTPRDRIWEKISNERRVLTAERLGEWLPTIMQPGDTVFVMCTMPSFYAVADTDPVYPYMWWDSVHSPKGAQQAMIDLFTGPNPPTWVPRVNSVERCNRSGEVGDVFRERYHLVRIIFGVPIYRLNTGPAFTEPDSR